MGHDQPQSSRSTYAPVSLLAEHKAWSMAPASSQKLLIHWNWRTDHPLSSTLTPKKLQQMQSSLPQVLRQKNLKIPGTDEEAGYWNKGISACAVCDGSSPLFRWVDSLLGGSSLPRYRQCCCGACSRDVSSGPAWHHTSDRALTGRSPQGIWHSAYCHSLLFLLSCMSTLL